MTRSLSQTAILKTWDSLASDYAQLLEKYSIFRTMAKRLLALAPVNSQQAIADVGAGTGLLAQEILKICPDIELHTIEPAPEMAKLVQENVKGTNVYYHCLSAEAIATLPYQFDGIFSNAVFHLVELEQVFQSLSAILKPKGKIVFNLWWHSFEETSQEDCAARFGDIIKQLLNSYELTPPEPNWIHLPFSRVQIAQWAAAAQLTLEQVIVDTDKIDLMFFADFIRMYSERPHPDLIPSQRQQFFQQVRHLLQGQQTTIVSTRFVIGKY